MFRKALAFSFFVAFIIFGLIGNLCQLILYVTIWNINRQMFRKINYYFTWMVHAQLLFLANWFCGVELRLHATEEIFEIMNTEMKHSMVIMNHHYEIDWLFGFMVNNSLDLHMSYVN